MERSVDVVVVGGGIAGCALARTVAGSGSRVLVLERQTAYRDKVRGEFLHPWGVAEAIQLGLDEILLAGGGSWITEAMGYDELIAPSEVVPFPLAMFRPDVPGAMDLGHPQTCAALAAAAEAAGAEMARGVGDVLVSPGPSPCVRFELDDVLHEVSCRIVVAADGRASGVRRQLGLELHGTEAKTWGAGMLIAGLEGVPLHQAALGTEDDLHYLIFPREGGFARLYQWYSLEQSDRFSGPDRQREFLDSFRMDCLPFGEIVAAAEPAGPCARYPMNNTWIDTVAVPGVVLVGDAAGYTDAIIGEGLSIALRDARMVAEVLCGGDDWSVSAFGPYADERAERMRRLTICALLFSDLRCTFTPAGRARRGAFFGSLEQDPMVALPTFVAAIGGPEQAPPEAFAPENIERILALA
jgi:2-polyprenyl-6-methoxyphenol hydroxylase-like FAD-dependent oxidoreductase